MADDDSSNVEKLEQLWQRPLAHVLVIHLGEVPDPQRGLTLFEKGNVRRSRLSCQHFMDHLINGANNTASPVAHQFGHPLNLRAAMHKQGA